MTTPADDRRCHDCGRTVPRLWWAERNGEQLVQVCEDCLTDYDAGEQT